MLFFNQRRVSHVPVALASMADGWLDELSLMKRPNLALHPRRLAGGAGTFSADLHVKCAIDASGFRGGYGFRVVKRDDPAARLLPDKLMQQRGLVARRSAADVVAYIEERHGKELRLHRLPDRRLGVRQIAVASVRAGPTSCLQSAWASRCARSRSPSVATTTEQPM